MASNSSTTSISSYKSFKEYFSDLFMSCTNNIDTYGWGWFIDIEQNTHNKQQRIHNQNVQTYNKQFYNCNNYPLKTKKSYSDMRSSSDLIFAMDDNYDDDKYNASCKKKITYNLIGIIFITIIYIILL